MMNWEELLSSARLGRNEPETAQAQRSPFQRDFDRIVFSSAFRRLQDKTQVFPMAESDYVRTRLTHSLEAACVGRSLGTIIGAHILEKHSIPGIHASDIGAIVAAACLAHDIGNPPFGHSGEDAIQHWFKNSQIAAAVCSQLSPGEISDFARFEGNAQGFRILTRLQMPDNPGGLQLTSATLGAFAKYPIDSQVSESDRKRASTKKFSFFHSEAGLFREVAESTGLLPWKNNESTGEGIGCTRWCRHPLAFVVEAADDICYRLVDFEDGVRVGILQYEEVRDAFVRVIGSSSVLDRADRMQGEKERIEFLRALAIGRALDQVAEVFIQNEDALLRGEFEQPLIACTEVAGPLDAIVRRSMATIYGSPRGVEIESAGFEVIGGLLDLFVGAAEDCASSGGKPAPRSRKLLQLVPTQFIGMNRAPGSDAYARLQRMTDFVSGMTDSYAVGLYKKLRGISLPGQ